MGPAVADVTASHYLSERQAESFSYMKLSACRLRAKGWGKAFLIDTPTKAITSGRLGEPITNAGADREQ